MKCCSEEDILYTTRHNELYVRKYVGMEEIGRAHV